MWAVESAGASLRILVDDLESNQQQLLAKKYKYGRPGLHDQEWGTREMPVGDGLGNKLIFYKDLPNK